MPFFKDRFEDLSIVLGDELLQGSKIVCQCEKRMFFRGIYEERLLKVFCRKCNITVLIRQKKTKTHVNPFQPESLESAEAILVNNEVL